MSFGKLLIRAEASPTIGYGHAARCLALAQEWLAEGGAVTWWTGPDVPEVFKNLWTSAGAQLVQEVAPQFASREFHSTVIDGIHYSPLDVGELRRWTSGTLAVVDDDGRFDSAPADLLINPNAGAEDRSRFHGDKLCGTDFTWLRREVRGTAQRQKLFAEPPRLLVSFGGTMPDEDLLKILDAAEAGCPADWSIRAVVGQRSALNGTRGRVTFLKNVTDMGQLFATSELFLGAGGHTLWELSYHGLPALIVTIAENQKPGVENWSGRGLVRWVGDWQDLKISPQMIDEALAKTIAEGPVPRLAWSENLQKSLDGAGAARVAARLRQLPFYLRPVSFLDEKLLWEWASDAEVRRQSFSSDPIPWDKHREWFASRLRDPASRIWIAEISGTPLGVFRYTAQVDGEIEVGVGLAPEARGQGWGKSLIDRASIRAFREDGVRRLVARVKTSNPASRRAFEKAGYRWRGDVSFGGAPAWELVRERE